MKRLVWLLLAVFSTAVAQVQPVELLAATEQACTCCEIPGGCGMPDCVPQTVSAQPTFNLPSPERLARLAGKRTTAIPRDYRARFYAPFLPCAPAAPGLRTAYTVAPAASVPLFREHCSLLL